MKKPLLNEFQRFIIRTDTFIGARLQLSLALAHLRREVAIIMNDFAIIQLLQRWRE